ncbi:hypothetical protein VPH35_119489 [Triticum aestivum]|uniref:Late embryogenesis abundant protein LEA-2 subgroup domain-containing protein n=1 Tax=Aegilops tauschii TaxID=37682 RepID=R7WEW4_AEGTA
MARCCGSLVCFLVLLAAIGGVIVWGLKIPITRYSVTIDSVSGLDPAMDLRLPALNPAFNLTLRVYSGSVLAHACIAPGMYLEVAYRCVKLAASPTVQQRLCVGPKETADQRIVTRGSGVRVPGVVLDSLAEDMRQGLPVFQVTIRQSGGVDDDDELVVSCGGRRVGAAAADLGTVCDAFHLCTDVKS